MRKTLDHKKKTTGASDGTHQTLLLDSGTTRVNSQKVKFYLTDGFITILLAVVALLFLIILAAAVALHLGNHSSANQLVRERFDQGENSTTDSLAFSASNDTTPVVEVVTADLEAQTRPITVATLAQDTHVEKDSVPATDD